VVEGRRAARALGQWCRQFGLSEPEFQVLWVLRAIPEDGLDQATLAGRLALSPAQVSATVERLRTQGWIAQHNVPGDRRRHLWQLTPVGGALLRQMLTDTEALRIADCGLGNAGYGLVSPNPPSAIRSSQSEKEAA
jgi:MarR family transcriptional repressor of emrRAB